MSCVMSWDEWAKHDAVGLAERVRNGDVTPTELAQQAAAGIAKVNPALSAVVEVFDDVVADPLLDGMNPARSRQLSDRSHPPGGLERDGPHHHA